MRFAEAGEFSKIAFLNGKIDLVQAEAIPDLIAAETESQHRQALKQLQGELGVVYDNWRVRIIETLALIESAIDFPDEDLPQNRGRGIAFRDNQPDHYAEVKTQGFRSNTFISITQNDNTSTALLGDGSPGGNIVIIKQNNGVRRTQ